MNKQYNAHKKYDGQQFLQAWIDSDLTDKSPFINWHGDNKLAFFDGSTNKKSEYAPGSVRLVWADGVCLINKDCAITRFDNNDDLLKVLERFTQEINKPLFAIKEAVVQSEQHNQCRGQDFCYFTYKDNAWYLVQFIIKFNIRKFNPQDDYERANVVLSQLKQNNYDQIVMAHSKSAQGDAQTNANAGFTVLLCCCAVVALAGAILWYCSAISIFTAVLLVVVSLLVTCAGVEFLLSRGDKLAGKLAHACGRDAKNLEITDVLTINWKFDAVNEHFVVEEVGSWRGSFPEAPPAADYKDVEAGMLGSSQNMRP